MLQSKSARGLILTRMFRRIQKLPWSLLAIPIIAIAGIGGFLFFNSIDQPLVATILIWVVILVGSLDLLRDTFVALVHGRFALDYIAILAISAGLVTQEYIVAAVIVLMLATGEG